MLSAVADGWFAMSSGECESFCGRSTGGEGFAMGNRSSAAFSCPRVVCRDPINASGYFLADSSSIRYFDEAKDQVTLIAGSSVSGTADGVGADARFQEIDSMIVSSQDGTIWCADGGAGLRSINGTTRQVLTSMQRRVTALLWDHSSLPAAATTTTTATSTTTAANDTKHDSAFYCMFVGTECRTYRFDTNSQKMSIVGQDMRPLGCTPSGYLIWADVSNGSYAAPVSVYDPRTRSSEPLQFRVNISSPPSFVLIDSTRTLLTANGIQLTNFTLPPQYFPLSKFCDCDL